MVRLVCLNLSLVLPRVGFLFGFCVLFSMSAVEALLLFLEQVVRCAFWGSTSAIVTLAIFRTIVKSFI